jgi:hypothetical protein
VISQGRAEWCKSGVLTPCSVVLCVCVFALSYGADWRVCDRKGRSVSEVAKSEGRDHTHRILEVRRTYMTCIENMYGYHVDMQVFPRA